MHILKELCTNQIQGFFMPPPPRTFKNGIPVPYPRTIRILVGIIANCFFLGA